MDIHLHARACCQHLPAETVTDLMMDPPVRQVTEPGVGSGGSEPGRCLVASNHLDVDTEHIHPGCSRSELDRPDSSTPSDYVEIDVPVGDVDDGEHVSNPHLARAHALVSAEHAAVPGGAIVIRAKGGSPRP